MLTSIRHPRRRAISVGPQSEADAYETLAYREKRRRESMNASQGTASSITIQQPSTPNLERNSDTSPSRVTAKLNNYEHMMGTGSASIPGSPAVNALMDEEKVAASPPAINISDEDALLLEPDENEMFSKLEKPRVRYDVEVVTKLIVYSGESYSVEY